MSYVYTVEHNSAVRNDSILPLATTWMSPDIIMLNEKSDRKNQGPYDFTHIKLKTTHEQKRKTNKNS